MVFDLYYGFLLKVKVAIIGVEAGGVGLDFSAAQNVVFVELPKTPSLLLQVFCMYCLFWGPFLRLFLQKARRLLHE